MATQAYLDTGYDPIDEEHRSIAERLDALFDAVDASDAGRARELAHAVFKEIASHFAHEERLMVQWGYPKLDRHRDAHASFLGDAARFAAELDASGITPATRRWVFARLSRWFDFHVVSNDVELGLFLREHARRPAS